MASPWQQEMADLVRNHIAEELPESQPLIAAVLSGSGAQHPGRAAASNDGAEHAGSEMLAILHRLREEHYEDRRPAKRAVPLLVVLQCLELGDAHVLPDGFHTDIAVDASDDLLGLVQDRSRDPVVVINDE